MSDGYTKLFASITDSTIWAEDHATRIVWVTMLAMADRHGYVGASIPGLACRARVSVQEAAAAIEKFLAPDPYSRSRENEGRRIAETERGWILLNHEKFRRMRSEEEKREADARRMAEKRERTRLNATKRDTSQDNRQVAKVAYAEAEAEAEAEAGSPSPNGEGSRAVAVEPKKRASRGKPKAVVALESALASACDCPPALTNSLATKAARRLDSLVSSGKASSLDDAATRLVKAWVRLGTDNAWKLLDVTPVIAQTQADDPFPAHLRVGGSR